MPRPDKRIVPGPDVGAPSGGVRSYRWTKYDGPETADNARVTPTTLEISVDDVTVVTDVETDDISKWDQRGTAAHVIEIEEAEPVQRITEYRKEWIIDRSIDGRTYRRSDVMTMVEVRPGD
jgi:hypothetical protein